MKYNKDKIIKQKISKIIYAFLRRKDIPIESFNGINFEEMDDSVLQEDLVINITSKTTLNDLVDMLEYEVHGFEDRIGIVFTPKYISDYMIEICSKLNNDSKIIDPGCGGGIFLVSTSEKLHSMLGKSYSDIFRDNIYGIDINEKNVEISRYVLELLALLNGENTNDIKFNVCVANSLNNNWKKIFNVSGFDVIIGNPPYYNTHDMNNDEIKFFKENFKTTSLGSFNIFYAFIEESFKNLKSEESEVIYILPNNFFTISSAESLRTFLVDNNYINKIIDFSDNMIFKPVRTYNCIMVMSNSGNDTFKYKKIKKTNDIKKALQEKAEYIDIETRKIGYHTWHLVDSITKANLEKIESQFYSLKNFVKTGIATLKDAAYMVDKDSDGFYKVVDGVRYNIEPDIVRAIYKIPELKKSDNLKDIERYIIFPYRLEGSRMQIIPEDEMISRYKQTYDYLFTQKDELDSRDKGKPNSVTWYAYGRTQGLQNIGEKLLFPTFSNTPKFTVISDPDVLFCNGYGVFTNGILDIKILEKFLNSKVMDYYIKNTSYPIEGGYYCYQKKYIQNFSLPFLNDEQRELILNLNDTELENFLINKVYKLNL